VLGACTPQGLRLHVARPSTPTAEALCRIGELYVIEKTIRGKPPDERLAVRRARAKPLLDDPERWPTSCPGTARPRSHALATSVT